MTQSPQKSSSNTVYLAGFDVFLPDPIARGEELKSICASKGLNGLYPMDNQLPAGLQGPEAAKWILKANLELIRQSKAIVANVNYFRGFEPDSGTSFEIGYAVALGIPVYAYHIDHVSMIDAIPNKEGICGYGYSIENFGLTKNLMLASSWEDVFLTAEAAIEAAAVKILENTAKTKHKREALSAEF